jgi:Fur family peroxide stress response transcriptional regulator
MKVSVNQIKDRLVEKGLKVTPQRIAVLQAIYVLNNHPTAEMIMEHIKETHPGIASATVYKVLDALEENQLIARVKTDRDIKRFDGIVENHHHLYSSDSKEIKDYMNAELDQLLADFFKKNSIKGFSLEEIKLQLIGKFRDPENQE